MRFAVPLWLALAGVVHATEAPLEVPSGQDVYFLDSAPGAPGTGLVYRFRFVAPDIGEGKIDFDAAAPDMEHLCNTYALPRLPTLGPRPSQIIISLSDRPVDFGTADPDVTQFFEAYAVEDDACIWEVF